MAKIIEAVNKLKRDTRLSVPYECQANSSSKGEAMSKNQTGKMAEVKVNEPLSSN